MRGGRARIVGLTAAALLALGCSAVDAGAAFRLVSPKRAAVVSKPPLLRWKPAPGATSYNVQVWRGNRKVLSRWPVSHRLQLHRRWRFHGRFYRLTPARYRWYVWPAYSWGYGSFRSRAFIVGRVPTLARSPLVTGAPREGHSLSATKGWWRGTRPLSFSYVWKRCDTGGFLCRTIAGATSKVLVLTADDIDYTVRVVVIARNLAGRLRAPSARTAVVRAAPPINVSKPKVAGGFQQGRIVAAKVGSWQSSRPLTFSFRWQRCSRTGSACRSIPGATVAAYLLRPADFMRRVKVVVRATNSGGASHASALSPVVGRIFYGTGGPDWLSSSNGSDLIRPGSGSDRVFAGRGNDRVVARDGQIDFIVCGPGTDVAIVDHRDHVRRCETVKRG